MHAVIDNGGHFWTGEYRFLRADGSYANILDRGYVIHDDHGGAVRMIGSMMDITQRRRNEERLRQQAALIQAAQDAIVVLDMEDRITFWNPGAERLYGWIETEALGRAARELLHSECVAELSAARRMLFARGEWSGELRQVTKSGHPLIVESRWTLVADELGRPRSMLIVNTDVTEKKSLQSQVLHAQRMESVGTLAGGVAHEFNNLLQTIRGYTQYGMQGLDPADQRWQDLDQVLKAAERAGTLTRQLLSFGRQQPLERRDVDPNQVVDELAQMLRPLIGAHIDLQLLPGDVPQVNADAAQLQQVLMNLCINARDAMPDGGKLLLKTEHVEISSDFCSAYPTFKPGSYVVLTVADTGCGMTPEVRQRIFEPFFTTKGVGEGTGLGLAMAYGIVQQHDGTIHVYSEPGKGTTFKIFIPASQARVTEQSVREKLNLEGRCLASQTTG
jgi:PAS domain S-box-containing protein